MIVMEVLKMDDNIVYLCNCHMLDVNHEHTVNFNNKQS